MDLKKLIEELTDKVNDLLELINLAVEAKGGEGSGGARAGAGRPPGSGSAGGDKIPESFSNVGKAHDFIAENVGMSPKELEKLSDLVKDDGGASAGESYDNFFVAMSDFADKPSEGTLKAVKDTVQAMVAAAKEIAEAESDGGSPTDNPNFHYLYR